MIQSKIQKKREVERLQPLLPLKTKNLNGEIMSKDVKNVKKRNWAFVVYPESLPENWLEILQKTGLPIAISPLHDKDLNADESEKKPHYHIILCYSGPTSYGVVKNITDKLNGTIPIPLEQIRGYYRYLTHEDNPEKSQYNKSEIKHLNGFNIRDFIELTKTEVSKIKREIRSIIFERCITEYSDLMLLLDNEGINERIEVAENNTIHFDALLRSLRHKIHKDKG